MPTATSSTLPTRVLLLDKGHYWRFDCPRFSQALPSAIGGIGGLGAALTGSARGACEDLRVNQTRGAGGAVVVTASGADATGVADRGAGGAAVVTASGSHATGVADRPTCTTVTGSTLICKCKLPNCPIPHSPSKCGNPQSLGRTTKCDRCFNDQKRRLRELRERQARLTTASSSSGGALERGADGSRGDCDIVRCNGAVSQEAHVLPRSNTCTGRGGSRDATANLASLPTSSGSELPWRTVPFARHRSPPKSHVSSPGSSAPCRYEYSGRPGLSGRRHAAHAANFYLLSQDDPDDEPHSAVAAAVGSSVEPCGKTSTVGPPQEVAAAGSDSAPEDSDDTELEEATEAEDHDDTHADLPAVIGADRASGVRHVSGATRDAASGATVGKGGHHRRRSRGHSRRSRASRRPRRSRNRRGSDSSDSSTSAGDTCSRDAGLGVGALPPVMAVRGHDGAGADGGGSGGNATTSVGGGGGSIGDAGRLVAAVVGAGLEISGHVGVVADGACGRGVSPIVGGALAATINGNGGGDGGAGGGGDNGGAPVVVDVSSGAGAGAGAPVSHGADAAPVGGIPDGRGGGANSDRNGGGVDGAPIAHTGGGGDDGGDDGDDDGRGGGANGDGAGGGLDGAPVAHTGGGGHDGGDDGDDDGVDDAASPLGWDGDPIEGQGPYAYFQNVPSVDARSSQVGTLAKLPSSCIEHMRTVLNSAGLHATGGHADSLGALRFIQILPRLLLYRPLCHKRKHADIICGRLVQAVAHDWRPLEDQMRRDEAERRTPVPSGPLSEAQKVERARQKLTQGQFSRAVSLLERSASGRPTEAALAKIRLLFPREQRTDDNFVLPANSCLPNVSPKAFAVAIRTTKAGTDADLTGFRTDWLRQITPPASAYSDDTEDSEEDDPLYGLRVFCVTMASGTLDLPQFVYDDLTCARLVAPAKPDGSPRPICIGGCFRRAGCKSLVNAAGPALRAYFEPRGQFGCGTKSASEKLHLRRALRQQLRPRRTVIISDARNGFNSISRDAIAAGLAALPPSLLWIRHMFDRFYGGVPVMYFAMQGSGDMREVDMERGSGQGDGASMIYFAAGMDAALQELRHEFPDSGVAAYVDDVTADAEGRTPTSDTCPPFSPGALSMPTSVALIVRWNIISRSMTDLQQRFDKCALFCALFHPGMPLHEFGPIKVVPMVKVMGCPVGRDDAITDAVVRSPSPLPFVNGILRACRISRIWRYFNVRVRVKACSNTFSAPSPPP